MGNRAMAQRGFTLLELLLSMTILAVVVILVLGAFQVGVRAWEKGERDIAAQERRRVVLDLMKRQIASLLVRVPPDVPEDEDEKPLLFTGDSEEMAFISNLALFPGHRFGLVYVKYKVGRDSEGAVGIQLFERNTVFMKKNANLDHLKKSDYVWLLEGMGKIRFAYLKPPEEESAGGWVDSWDAEEERGYPAAVMVTVEPGDKTPPISVIAPILPEVVFE